MTDQNTEKSDKDNEKSNQDIGQSNERKHKRWMNRRFKQHGGVKVIETKCTVRNDNVVETKDGKKKINGIDYACVTPFGDVFISEVKSKTGSPSKGQFTLDWIRLRMNPELRQAVTNAVENGRHIIQEVVRVKTVKGKTYFNTTSQTKALQWHDLYPDEPSPLEKKK